MSLYSRARKHFDLNRVKKLREEKIKEEKILHDLVEAKKSDWRKDLQKP